MIFNKFKILTQLYIKDINNKRILLNKDNSIYQEVLDKYLSLNSNSLNNQNLKLEEELKSDDAYNKLNILCVTWNIGGIKLNPNSDISEIFTHNYFYFNDKSPDIIVVTLQEIVCLKLFTVLFTNENKNKDLIENLRNFFENLLNKIFPGLNYIASFPLNIVGLFVIILVRENISQKIYFKKIKEIKNGKFNLGNKGFTITSFQYMDKIFSIAGCHFEAEAENNKNDKRIKTIYDILNQDVNVQSESINKLLNLIIGLF